MASHLLQDKIIVVTGGAGLLGQSFVRAVVEHGGFAVLADLNDTVARQVVTELDHIRPGRCEAAWLDITNHDSINGLITTLQQRHGRIDAVVNNAYPRNKNYGRKLEDVTYADFCENVDMHLGGYFLVAQQFCLAFKAQGHGNLINMSSIYGTMTPRFEVYDGTPMTMPVEYAAIKSSIVQLTRYFAQYFKGTGIRVNCLSPGGILANQPTDFLTAYDRHCASKGMLTPDDLLGTLLYLLSDESQYMTGQNLVVDDGFSL
jgi:NAD(P)-dependent dehydrogenase (short-subunit alcohol dehydrogenase family)